MSTDKCSQCPVRAAERTYGVRSYEARVVRSSASFNCCQRNTPPPPMPSITEVIELATDKVVGKRVVLQEQRMSDERLPVLVPPLDLPRIEVRGLAGDVKAVRTGMQSLRDAFKNVRDHKRGLLEDLHQVAEMLHKHRMDIRFEAESLGNGSSEDEEKSGG